MIIKTPKQQLLDFAMQEFARALSSVKKGKQYQPKKLQRAMQTLSQAEQQLQAGKITEEEMDAITNDLLHILKGEK